MEYCCYGSTDTSDCCLEMLDKLQKQVCGTVGPSLAASLEPLVHHWGAAEVLAELVPIPYSFGRSTHCSDRLHDFSVTLPRCYKDVYVNSFFPCTARLLNFLPIEHFPLTYDVNGFNSRINRHLFYVVSS